MVVAAGIGSVVEIAVVAVAVTAAGEAAVVAFALEFVAEGNIVVVRVRELTSFAAAVVAAAVVAEIIVVVEPSSTFGSLLDKLRPVKTEVDQQKLYIGMEENVKPPSAPARLPARSNSYESTNSSILNGGTNSSVSTTSQAQSVDPRQQMLLQHQRLQQHLHQQQLQQPNNPFQQQLQHLTPAHQQALMQQLQLQLQQSQSQQIQPTQAQPSQSQQQSSQNSAGSSTQGPNQPALQPEAAQQLHIQYVQALDALMCQQKVLEQTYEIHSANLRDPALLKELENEYQEQTYLLSVHALHLHSQYWGMLGHSQEQVVHMLQRQQGGTLLQYPVGFGGPNNPVIPTTTQRVNGNGSLVQQQSNHQQQNNNSPPNQNAPGDKS